MALINDLIFISGEFEKLDLPRDKRYLYKYYKTPLQKAFLKYVFLFRSYENFINHTGFHCREKWMKVLFDKLIFLENLHKECKQNMDMKTLAKIETGKFKFSKKDQISFDPKEED